MEMNGYHLEEHASVADDRDEAICVLHDVLAAFGDLTRGFSTPEQQRALRAARELLARHGWTR